MTSFLTQAYSLIKQDTCCDLSIGIEFTVCIVYCHEDLGKAALLLTKRKNTIFFNQIIFASMRNLKFIGEHFFNIK